MEEYEAKLKTEQWLGGQQPSAADREAIEKMTAAPNVATFPNTFAWYCLVSKFTPAVRGTWSGAAPAKGGAKPAAAAKKDDDFDSHKINNKKVNHGFNKVDQLSISLNDVFYLFNNEKLFLNLILYRLVRLPTIYSV